MVGPHLYNLSWLVPGVPFFAFLIIFAIMRTPMARLGAWVSITGISVSAIMSALLLALRFAEPAAEQAPLAVNWITVGALHIQMGVLIDNLSAIMIFVVSFIATLIQIYSVVYMEHELDADFARFFAYMSLFAASMLLLVVAPNFAQIYIGWEMVGVCSYLLIGFWYFKKSAADACKKAFIVTRFGDMGFLMGIIMLFMATHSLNFTGPNNPLQTIYTGAQNGSFDSGLATAIALLIFCGAVGKSAQFPLHIWLPDAMEGPTPVSALIHAATMVAAGVYLVARCFPLFMATQATMLTVAYIGAFTSFMAATMGIVSNDIKRVLAYSTCSQLGYMIMALGAGGLTAGMFHLTTHAFFKALMFLGAGSVIHAMHTNDMWQMGGLRKHMPVTAWTFLMGCAAISGIPFFSGFFSKDQIYESVIESPLHQGVLDFAVVLIAAMTAFYMFRLYFVTFEGSYRGPGNGLSWAGTIETMGATAAPAPDAPHEEDVRAHHLDAHEVADPAANYYQHEGHALEGTPKENPWLMIGPLVILASFAVDAGWLEIPGLTHWFTRLISPHGLFGYMGGGSEAAVATGPNWPMMALSVTATLIGIGAAWAFYGPKLWMFQGIALESERKWRQQPIYSFFAHKWYMDDFWIAMVRIFMFGLATVSAWIDVNIINGAIDRIGAFTYKMGQLLREEHTGQVQQYVTIAVIGVLFFLLSIGFWQQGLIGPHALMGVMSR